MLRLPLLLISLLLCAFAIAACGGGDDDVDVGKVLDQTFGEDKDIKSGRLDVSLKLDAKGIASLQGPVSVRLSGPFTSTKPQELPLFDFEAELNAAGQAIKAGATSTGDKGFVTFQGQPYALSNDLYQQFKTGYAAEAKKSEGENGDGGVSFKSLGVDPQSWLRNSKYVGEEDVGGVKTLHISSGIDVPRLLEDVNRILGRAEDIQNEQAERARQLTEAERKQIAEAVKDAKIELWTGDEDKILRRLNVRLRFEVPEGNRQQANGLTSGTLSFDLGLGAINEKQKFPAPENAQPLDALIGGLAQPGAAQPGTGGETPAPTPEQGGGGGGAAGTPYEQCVQAAGADIDKLQECAGLAGG